MKTFVRMFRPEFWDAILEGRKRQTVRMTPSRMPAAGDTLDIRGWPGTAYAKGSKHHRLALATIQRVAPIEIRKGSVTVAGEPVNAEAFARKDGFQDAAAMWRWFSKSYGLNADEAFTGILIEWGPLK